MKIAYNIRNRHLFVGDLGLTVLSIIADYIVRLELIEIFANYYLSLIWMTGLSLIIKPVVYYLFGLYRRMWIYASMRELRLIVMAVTTATAIISPIMLVLVCIPSFLFYFPRVQFYLIDWVTSLMLLEGRASWPAR
jgi:FlaA1/EpsC-like NDP-sugar epimerase